MLNLIRICIIKIFIYRYVLFPCDFHSITIWSDKLPKCIKGQLLEVNRLLICDVSFKKHEAILIPHTPWATVDGLRDEHLTLTLIKASPSNSIFGTRVKVLDPSWWRELSMAMMSYHMKDVTVLEEGKQSQHAPKSRDKIWMSPGSG